jgi:hypothetical protein
MHWDPLLAALGLLDAAVVLAVLDAAPDAVHLRRRTDLSDENGREFGHELLSVEVRDGRVRAQYLAARTRLEPAERATRLAAVTPTILLPADPGSFLLAGVTGFETDWGGAYRVAALTTGMLFGGTLTRPLEIGLSFGPLTRDRAAISVAVGVEVSELPAGGGAGPG